MSSSNDIVARIRDKFLEAVEQDSEFNHLHAGLRQSLSDGKTPKATELAAIYQETIVPNSDNGELNGGECK